MAITTTLTSVSQRLAEGWGEWVLSGKALLDGLRAFAIGHTHTGTVDGLQIAAGGYAAGSIDADDIAASGVDTAELAANAVTTVKITDANVTVAKLSAGANLKTSEYVYGAEANTFDYPVFRAPAACVINAVYLTPAAAIVSATDNNHTLRIEKYSAAGATLSGTLCTIANTAATGTLAALVPTSFGTITGGTLTAGELLAFTKSTVGTGLAIGVGAALTIHYTPS